MKVPEVLLSGDHGRVASWRRQMSLKLTRERRPDLLDKAALAPEDRRLLHGSLSRLYVALLHTPVYDKNGQVVTTAVTNIDIHDVARSARTYGVRRFYVVTPVAALQKLVRRILTHWQEGYGGQYNQSRKEALSLVRLKDTLDDAIMDVEQECGSKPQLVATSARLGGKRTSFGELKEILSKNLKPFLILLGTGWGLAETVLAQADYVLEPIEGGRDYNHLSVRSAAAIILDRLLGQNV
jgi:tRNA (guanine37-N1)-methyltransferase